MTPKSSLYCFCVCLLFWVSGDAQNRNASFYFGTTVGWNTFEPRLLLPKDGPSSASVYDQHSCISDEKTGKLLFSTNGYKIWLPNTKLMEDGELFPVTEEISDVLIVPDPASPVLYYIFYVLSNNLYYAKVDMSTTGKVLFKQIPVMSNVAPSITATFASHKQAWWLIAHAQTGDTYYSFLIGANGITPIPVISRAGRSLAGNYRFDHLISSHKGDKLVVSGMTSSPGGETIMEILNIDKKCGTIYDAEVLFRTKEQYVSYTAFSPDDSKIYLITAYNNIVQYSGKNYTDSATIFLDSIILIGMMTGDDHKIYVFGLDQNMPSTRYLCLNTIDFPDSLFPVCTYNRLYTGTWNFTRSLGHPRQIMERLQPDLPDKIDFTFDYACTKLQAEFKILNDSIYDSIVWYFGDTASATANVSRLKNPHHSFSRSADYTVSVIGYNCGFIDTLSKVLKVRDRLNPQLGSDTTICADDSLILNSKLTGNDVSLLWPDGSTGWSYLAKDPGTYWVQVTIGDCKNTDSITLSKYPDIWTALGEEYLLCTDAGEVTKLDAGEGFQHYKWTPTGDTTQWINVADLGNYVVIVKDYRGCRGAGGTKVKRSCPVKAFFPNVFTPNGDGINDRYVPVGKDVTAFKMTIYNSWGEIVFETNDIGKTWDGTFKGKHCASGVYLYMAHYEGYIHKKLAAFDTRGNITLLR